MKKEQIVECLFEENLSCLSMFYFLNFAKSVSLALDGFISLYLLKTVF